MKEFHKKKQLNINVPDHMSAVTLWSDHMTTVGKYEYTHTIYFDLFHTYIWKMWVNSRQSFFLVFLFLLNKLECVYWSL